MQGFALAGAALLGFVGGWLLVAFLVTRPTRMVAALLGTIAATSAAAGCVALGAQGSRPWIGLLGVMSFGVGYLACARLVLGREDDRWLPELERQAEDPGDGHVAVVYFTHGEPERYDPIGWLNQFREFDDQGIAFVPFFARPFFLYGLRRSYLSVGLSQHRSRHLAMAEKVESWLHERGHTGVRVHPSFLDDDPRPDAALIDALNDGASAVIVSEVFVSISNHTAEGEELIEAIDAPSLGVPVLHTGPLWDSAKLHASFLDKLEAARGDLPRERVGVLLVGHGQPDEWDREWPTETEHELGLRRSVLELLVEAGYDRDKVDLAWMEFKSPKVVDRARELAESGIEILFYFSAGISAESLHSQYDVPELVAKAGVEGEVRTVNLGAWNDHPMVIHAIAERIEGLLPEAAAAIAAREGAETAALRSGDDVPADEAEDATRA